MELSKEEIIKTLEKHRSYLHSCGLRSISLFGSFASGDFSRKSDIDFLVEFQEGRGLFRDTTNVKEFLEKLFDRRIDIVKPTLIRDELKSDILEGKRYEAKI
ncbi:nucleotidyltransferase domain-containing protein [Candidatus Woesearchaeota archaeon]|nr:MAG: hypothetical protein QS99_C0012G0030 [archaeon GW2011_AR4]MBS3130648.1 nucleotidyltransferase domain-containing protein [Candidatus Woesearchaeota archaeon]HIH37957.1 nucleotidyltransferase [Candidatus Woesearchaeota archaeon]HIH48651.1 nucleotidyltransferase [Candidatus Woesearchaeota archaeon]HIJ03736.1 nucleotidyltransferase [Candidatus Woesearchaeota archaeon]